MSARRRALRAVRAVGAVALVLGIVVAVLWPTRAGAERAPRPAIAWSTPIDSGPRRIAVDGDGVVVVTTLGDVVALDAGGRPSWHAEVGHHPAAPAFDADVVVVGDEGALRGFDRTDGAPRWEQPISGVAWHVAAGGGTSVVADDAGLRAFDSGSGSPRWSLATPVPIIHPPFVDPSSGVVVVIVPGTPAGTLRVLDAGTGAVRWQAAADRFTAAPVVHGDTVFLAHGDGFSHAAVVARDLATGAMRWVAQVPASFESGIVPAVDGRALVVVDHFGHVTALDPADGGLLWERSLGETVLETRVVLTRRRVAVTDATGSAAVLDRVTGRVVHRRAARSLQGRAVDLGSGDLGSGDLGSGDLGSGDLGSGRAGTAGGGRRDRIVVAVRLGPRERVEQWRLP